MAANEDRGRLRGVRAGRYRPAVVSARNRYAPNYVYIDKPPGLVGSAWWLASIALIVDQPVGILFGERTLGLGWYAPLLGIASWVLYSLWRVETTHIWHSDLAHAILGRWFYRRYPTEQEVRVGDYFEH
jgi:hypothetical protein